EPDQAEAHTKLGIVLWTQGRYDEAAAACHRSLELRPDHAESHYTLGIALRAQGRYDEAAAAYRRALELKPALPEAHCNLGKALQRQGEFAQALAALKRGHELGSRRPGWPYPSARWVEECRRLAELEGRLPAVLRGDEQLASAAERNEFARLCSCKKFHAA